jgi:TetR/AcrR family transcriptional regulator
MTKVFAQDIAESKAGDILAAAERLFCRNGYDAVSMSSVAREAGVSKANVFHHFGSKDELYVAVLQFVQRELTRELHCIAAEPVGIEHSLPKIAEAHVRHLLAHGDRIRLFMREMLEQRPGHGKAMAEKVCGPNFTALVSLLREAQQRNEVRHDVDPNVTLLLLVASSVFLLQSQDVIRHLPGIEDTAADARIYSKQVVDILLHGIVPR